MIQNQITQIKNWLSSARPGALNIFSFELCEKQVVIQVQKTRGGLFTLNDGADYSATVAGKSINDSWSIEHLFEEIMRKTKTKKV